MTKFFVGETKIVPIRKKKLRNFALSIFLQHLMDEMDNSDTIITQVHTKGEEILQNYGDAKLAGNY